MTTYDSLPIGSTLIAPSDLHPLIREELLSGQTGRIGLRIFSLHGWLSTYTDMELPSMVQTLFEYKRILEGLQDSLLTYKEIACTTTFLKECYSFLDSLTFWNISLDQLPVKSDAQRELYRILKEIKDFTTPASATLSSLRNLSSLTLDSLYILDAYTTIEDQKILNYLYERGAHRIAIESMTPEKQFFHAVNKRQELEACAQYIIEHDLRAEDIQITLANASYKPLLAQIFDRYKIPYTIMSMSHTSIITKRFLALFQYVLHPDQEHFFTCIDSGLFAVEGLSKFRDYLEIFPSDLFTPFDHLQNLTLMGHVMDEREIEKLKGLEQEAEQVRLSLQDPLQALLHPHSYKTLIISIVALVQETLSSSSNEKSVFLQIEDILQEVFPYIHKDEDVEFVLPFIAEVSKSGRVNELKGVLISDLCQTCIGKKHHFMLGCTQKDYPAFKTKKGIFDETYHALIEEFPSMEIRYQFYLDQLDRMLYTAPFLYVSYPVGTYEGKGNEAALEIEQFMKQEPQVIKNSSVFPLYSNLLEVKTSYSITQAQAEALFVKDGQIHGSISAFERYVKCPFSYFLRYGLALREPMKHGFPDSYAGTLFHHILEQLCLTLGKDYTQAASDKLEELLHQEMMAMMEVFPSLSGMLLNVEQRILNSILETLHMLQEFEDHSLLHPNQFETSFSYDIPLREDVRLALIGFIDRIDASDEFTCILDYKSSSKTLSEANVFAALQLQLLTYSLVVKNATHKEVLGAYYVSLKNENIPYSAGKLFRRKPVTHLPSSREDYIDVRHKAHRLNGWTMSSQISALDDNGSHIVGISQNKEGVVKPRKLYDLHTIERYFTEMYQKIGNRILEGDIRCIPMEEACMFCSYHEICRFKGVYAEKTPMVDIEDDLYQNQKGSDEDA